jgi:uncharacterized protein
MGKRVLITGGSGLIGRALVRELTDHGHEAIVLSRQASSVEGLPVGARVVQWDGRSADGWGNLVEEGCAIVNLAGAGIADERWSEERKALIVKSRTQAGQAVMEAVRGSAGKPEVVVQGSATGFYGPDGPFDKMEDAPPGSDFLSQVCVKWEESTLGVQDEGVRWTAARTGFVLSAEGGALPRMAMPFRFFVGGPLGSGRQYIPWIHIADEVGAIRFLIENSKTTGPYNLTAPSPVTNLTFSRELGAALKRPSLMPVPAPALKLMFGEMAMMLLSGQRAVPNRLLIAGYDFRFPELRVTLRDLLR